MKSFEANQAASPECLFGLVGKNISYSFSRGYFAEKFEAMGLKNHRYVNFDIADPREINNIITENPNLKGVNVTIPYKESIMPYLHSVDPIAHAIGVVNTIKITPDGLVGYNTDWYGFLESIRPLLGKHHNKALLLGTGGASKAIAYVLSKLNMEYAYVSRTSTSKGLTYKDLSSKTISDYTVVVNCSPVGTFPNVEDCPDIPYHLISGKHLVYDLIYNPAETKLLRLAKAQGAATINGLKMLQLQAEKAWEIWNNPQQTS